MPAKLSSASFEFGIRSQPQSQGAAQSNLERRFNIVVMGDFTGRTNRGQAEPFANRKLTRVDCDNAEQIFTRLGAALKLPSGDARFSSLEDFHPDGLVAAVPSLARLFEARQLLGNPATADRGKTALQAILGAAIGAQPDSGPSESGPAAKAESDEATLGRLLGERPPTEAKPAAPSSVEQFVKQIVAPHVTPVPASGQRAAMDAADLELGKQLRAILHHPDFQALEAVWRGADFLLRRIEAWENIALFFLDVSLSELETGLLGEERAGLFRLLRDREVSLLIGNFVFGRTANDLRALGRMAEMAAQLGAPFLAAANPGLLGCDSFGRHADPDDWKTPLPADVDAAWQALRKLAGANHVGLAAPRFLLRQPYGQSGEAVEAFPFEELPGDGTHEAFLWGHPAVVCACVLVEAFQGQLAEGALDEAPGSGEVGELPVHKFVEDGESAIKPYAEAWLTERAGDRMLSQGIMPLLSRKDYNRIRLPSLNSVASPPTALPLRWG